MKIGCIRVSGGKQTMALQEDTMSEKRCERSVSLKMEWK